MGAHFEAHYESNLGAPLKTLENFFHLKFPCRTVYAYPGQSPGVFTSDLLFSQGYSISGQKVTPKGLPDGLAHQVVGMASAHGNLRPEPI